jgi:hypothetical protein
MIGDTLNDLTNLFSAKDKVARWRAEWENAGARMDLAQHDERCAELLSQHEPVASLGLDRQRLRLVLNYIRHGDLKRLDREFEELRIGETHSSK